MLVQLKFLFWFSLVSVIVGSPNSYCQLSVNDRSLTLRLESVTPDTIYRGTVSALSLRLKNVSRDSLKIAGFFDQGLMDPTYDSFINLFLLDSSGGDVDRRISMIPTSSEFIGEILRSDNTALSNRLDLLEEMGRRLDDAYEQALEGSVRVLHSHDELLIEFHHNFFDRFTIRPGRYYLYATYEPPDGSPMIQSLLTNCWKGSIISNRLHFIVQ